MPTTLVLLDERRPPVEVALPRGYRRVWRGALCPGDLWLDRHALLSGGRVLWRRLEAGHREHGAEWFFCLVRWGAPCDRECARCRLRPAALGWEVCRVCRLGLRRN